MKHVIDLEMEWGYIGRSLPTTKSIVRVEYVPYAPTLQCKLKNLHASVLSVEGWNVIAIPPAHSANATSERSNYTRFRILFTEDDRLPRQGTAARRFKRTTRRS